MIPTKPTLFYLRWMVQGSRRRLNMAEWFSHDSGVEYSHAYGGITGEIRNAPNYRWEWAVAENGRLLGSGVEDSIRQADKPMNLAFSALFGS